MGVMMYNLDAIGVQKCQAASLRPHYDFRSPSYTTCWSDIHKAE